MRIRRERQDLAAEIRSSYNTYKSPKLDRPAKRSAIPADTTADSMHARDRMTARYRRLMACERDTWEEVRKIQDRPMRQLITRAYLIGGGNCKKQDRIRIRNYLQRTEINER